MLTPSTNRIPDTTSHEFVWQIDILGDGNSSRLNDVCIIDENDVWAVGQIYLQDSAGQFIYPTYNAAHWDGRAWELIRVPVRDYGSPDTRPYPLRAVFAFGENDVWVNAGAALIQFDGREWHQRAFFLTSLNDSMYGPVNKMWGTSASDLYCVGNNGMTVHYDGSTWQKLKSGTNLDIQDIWGGKDGDTQEHIVLAVASNIFTGYEKEILQLTKSTVSQISTNGINWPVDALWFDPGRVYYAVGAGIYSKQSLKIDENWGGPGLALTTFTSHAIRGNHRNDIFVVGAFGDVLHYNGKSWRNYREDTALPSGSYFSVAIKDDLVFAVGENLSAAAVLCGKRTGTQWLGK